MRFFQCNVNIIENANIRLCNNNNVFMLHADKIAHVAIEKKLKWFQKNNFIFYTDIEFRNFFKMNQALLTKLSNGLSVFDKHNLYKFLNPSHFYNIVSY